MDMYSHTLMHHYRYPKHKGVLACPTFVGQLSNPSCGDSISWQGIVHNQMLTQIAFQGHGCVISQASASLLAQEIVGKTINEIHAMNDQTMRSLVGIELGPVRVQCALLSLQALHNSLSELQGTACSTVSNSLKK